MDSKFVIGIGVYGERTFNLVKAMTEKVQWRKKKVFGTVYTDDLAMAPDGELVFDINHVFTDFSNSVYRSYSLSAVNCSAADYTKKSRSHFAAKLFAITLDALRGLATERKALESLEAASASVAKLRSSEWAGREIPFGEGCAATVLECLCLIEAIKGEKSRPALVKMYGKATAAKVVGTPADPVTTAAAEAIRRSIVELKEKHAAERKALHEKLTEEIRKAAERYDAEVAMAEAEIRRLQGLTEGGQPAAMA